MLRKLLTIAGILTLVSGLNTSGVRAELPVDITGASFQGSMSISPGLWYPFIGPEVTAYWSFSSGLGLPFNVSGSGSLTGFCGSSTGSGVITISGSIVNNESVTVPITWQSLNGEFVYTGTDNGWTVWGSWDSRPLPSLQGAVPCLTEAATNFTTHGILFGVRVAA